MSDWERRMWSDARDLLREAERIKANLLESTVALRGETLGDPVWGPALNVYETADAVWIVVAVPGVEADRIEVRVEGSVLIVGGHRSLRGRLGEGRYHAMEIPMGRFERRLKIPLLRGLLPGSSRAESGPALSGAQEMPVEEKPQSPESPDPPAPEETSHHPSRDFP